MMNSTEIHKHKLHLNIQGKWIGGCKTLNSTLEDTCCEYSQRNETEDEEHRLLESYVLFYQCCVLIIEVYQMLLCHIIS